MSGNSGDLYGSAPEKSLQVLLLIDVINDLEFPGGEELLRQALPTAHRIVALKKRARAAGVPVVYVNDNFGRWRSNFRCQVDHCLAEGIRGREVAHLLVPEEQDYFVLKPKHSGFFSTSLDILLKYLGAKTLILAGFAGNLCVLYTANDAYMRDFRLLVPADCVASETAEANAYALAQMERYLGADTADSEELELSRS